MNWLLGNCTTYELIGCVTRWVNYVKPRPHHCRTAAQPCSCSTWPGANAANTSWQQRGTVGDVPPRSLNSGTTSAYVCLLTPSKLRNADSRGAGEGSCNWTKTLPFIASLFSSTNKHSPALWDVLGQRKIFLHLASGWQLLCSFTITSPIALIMGNFPQTYVASVAVVCCYAMLRCQKMKLVLFVSSNRLMESRAFKFPNNLLLSATAAWEDRHKPGIDSKSKALGSAWAPQNKHHSGVKPCKRTTLGQRKERATWHGVLSSARPGLLPRPGLM